MKQICRRCRHEGRLVIVREREPLEDPRIIGWPGLCADHARQVRAEQERQLGKPLEQARVEGLELSALLLVLATPHADVAKAHPDPGPLKFKAAHRLVERALHGRPPRLKNPNAQRVLREIAIDRNQSPAALLGALLLPAGVLLATSYLSAPRRIRLGKEWVTNESGKAAPIRPDDLDLTSCSGWLIQEAFRSAETDALGAPPQPAVPLDEFPDACQPGIAPDELAALRHEIAMLDKDATPRERELLRLLAENPDTNDLPALLGVTASTLRVVRSNLRKKARAV